MPAKSLWATCASKCFFCFTFQSTNYTPTLTAHAILFALQKTGTDDEIICHFFTLAAIIFVVVNLFFSFLNDILLFWMVDLLKIEKKNVGMTSTCSAKL